MTAKAFFFSTLLPFCLLSRVGVAQQAGLYLTYTDYDLGRISYAKQENIRYKMITDCAFHGRIIKITIGDSLYTFYKDSIFAYRDPQNNCYRLYQQGEYKILNPGEPIMLYSLDKTISSKGFETETNYYFSTGSNTAILPLTIMNVKKAYPLLTGFHTNIDMYFSGDADLVQYDSFYKIYSINRIYQLNTSTK